MKQYLAVYTGTAAGAEAFRKLPAEEMARRQDAGMKSWHAWVEKHASAIVIAGGPLGKTKRNSKSGIEDIRNSLAAFTVVQAESYDAAARMFVDHPHFTLFPGDGVEVMEILPIPGQ